MWFKVDDGLANHPKMRAAIAEAGPGAMALWLAAGTLCASANSEGVVADLVAKDAAYLSAADLAPCAAALVRAGLWHDGRTFRRCDACSSTLVKLPKGAYYFHDWLNPWQLTKAEAREPEDRAIWRKRKDLERNRDLCERIYERDRGHCRYCQVKVNMRDRKGPTGGTRDHVEPLPWGENTLDNVVIACRRCNAEKSNRTPAEAGMRLAPIEEHLRLLAGSSPDLTADLAGSDHGSGLTGARARNGTGQIGIQPGQVPDLAGLVPALASNGHTNGNGTNGSNHG